MADLNKRYLCETCYDNTDLSIEEQKRELEDQKRLLEEKLRELDNKVNQTKTTVISPVNTGLIIKNGVLMACKNKDITEVVIP